MQPQPIDLPLGFSMRLAKNPGAMQVYANLSREEQTALIRRMQSAKTGEEGARLIDQVVEELSGFQ